MKISRNPSASYRFHLPPKHWFAAAAWKSCWRIAPLDWKDPQTDLRVAAGHQRLWLLQLACQTRKDQRLEQKLLKRTNCSRTGYLPYFPVKLSTANPTIINNWGRHDQRKLALNWFMAASSSARTFSLRFSSMPFTASNRPLDAIVPNALLVEFNTDTPDFTLFWLLLLKNEAIGTTSHNQLGFCLPGCTRTGWRLFAFHVIVVLFQSIQKTIWGFCEVWNVPFIYAHVLERKIAAWQHSNSWAHILRPLSKIQRRCPFARGTSCIYQGLLCIASCSYQSTFLETQIILSAS